MSNKELVAEFINVASSKTETLCVYSDEVIELDITERTTGHVIEHALNAQIKRAREKDLNLAVFVCYPVRAWATSRSSIHSQGAKLLAESLMSGIL